MSAKYAFIAAEKATRNTDGSARYTVVLMCTWLAVSTSGFYEWCTRPASATAQRRERLGALIEHIFDEHDGTYGYRRVHAVLARRGHYPRRFTIEDLTRPRNAPKCLSCNEILDLRRSKNHVREGTW